MEHGLELDEPYPESRGVWPALALYFVFVWVELVFGGPPAPFNIALLAVLFSLVTWAGEDTFRYGVDNDISHEELAALIDGSAVEKIKTPHLSRGCQRLRIPSL